MVTRHLRMRFLRFLEDYDIYNERLILMKQT